MSDPTRKPTGSGRRLAEGAAPTASGGAADERWARALAGEGDLASADHEALLSLALGDDVARVTEQARSQAAALARALELGTRRPFRAPPEGGREEGGAERPNELDELLGLAQAVRAASGRAELDELTNERLLRRALGRARPRSSGAVRWASAGAVAAAAAVALWWAAGPALGPTQAGPASAVADATGRAVLTAAALVPERSTQPLFDAAVKFPVRGGESERLDRIATARATDLRANRYAMWGVP